MDDNRTNKRTAEEIVAEILKSDGGEPFKEANRLCGDDDALRNQVFILLQQEDSADSDAENEFAEHYDSLYGEKQKVGSFSLERHLGSGGNGDVYLALRTRGPKQKVAIKFLRPLESRDARRNEEFRKRFARELQLLAMLDHPYIVKFFDSRNFRGRPYFVMEFVDGSTLDEFAEENRLTVPERVNLFLKICRAVEHLENNLVVHRDLKPSNIMVDAAGNPKLLDFGIAKSLRSELLDGEMITHSPIPPLTPQYASPEQWRNGRATFASDVYSLAVIFYQLLTGSFPVTWHGKDDLAAYRDAVCRGNHLTASQNIDPEHSRLCRESSPEALSKKLRGDLDAILAKALRVDVNERYPSVPALIDDIERYLHFEPLSARQGLWAYRLRRFLRRNWSWILSIGAVILALSIGLVVALWQRNEAITQKQTKEQLVSELQTKANRLQQLSGEQQAETADLHLQLKNMADDIEKYIKNLQRQGKLRGEDTPNPERDALLGQSYALLARMRVRSGERTAAQEAYRTCLTYLNRAQKAGDETLATIKAKQDCEKGLAALSR